MKTWPNVINIIFNSLAVGDTQGRAEEAMEEQIANGWKGGQPKMWKRKIIQSGKREDESEVGDGRESQNEQNCLNILIGIF